MNKLRMEDIARAAGVSSMTVSRALRAPDSVALATRLKILKLVKESGYVPDLIAGGLASKRSGFVSLLVPSINNVHYAEMAAALKEGLAPAGLQVLIGMSNYQPSSEENLVETMLRRRPEAIVLTNDGHSARTKKLLLESRIPVIDTWELPVKPIGHAVGFSNRQAMRQIVEHLISRGYKRIGYIGEANDSGTRGTLRRQGFLDAMLAANLDTTRQLADAIPPINMLQGRSSFDRLIERWPDTQAVMCVSDPAAFGALTSCQMRGWKVPERMAIAGFGSFEISACAVPPITTVRVSGRELGAKTAELILQLREAKESGIRSGTTNIRTQKVLLETSILVRASS
jgi:LacI family transcriptional regulator, gluconate utilization system Gnt-I transcriptional repressor